MPSFTKNCMSYPSLKFKCPTERLKGHALYINYNSPYSGKYSEIRGQTPGTAGQTWLEGASARQGAQRGHWAS